MIYIRWTLHFICVTIDKTVKRMRNITIRAWYKLGHFFFLFGYFFSVEPNDENDPLWLSCYYVNVSFFAVFLHFNHDFLSTMTMSFFLFISNSRLLNGFCSNILFFFNTFFSCLWMVDTRLWGEICVMLLWGILF